jgi:hypothetical protein
MIIFSLCVWYTCIDQISNLMLLFSYTTHSLLHVCTSLLLAIQFFICKSLTHQLSSVLSYFLLLHVIFNHSSSRYAIFNFLNWKSCKYLCQTRITNAHKNWYKQNYYFASTNARWNCFIWIYGYEIKNSIFFRNLNLNYYLIVGYGLKYKFALKPPKFKKRCA